MSGLCGAAISPLTRHQNQDLSNLTLQHTILTLRKKPFAYIVGKGENAGNQNFLLFPQCFHLSRNIFYFFGHIYSVICKVFEFGLV